MSRRNRSRLAAAIVVGALASGVDAFAAMQRGPMPSTAAEAGEETLLERAETAVRAGDCFTALPLLERARKADAKNADVWNLLAYCQRKTGRLDDAFANYRRALELRPKFPAAREYLGEAHLQAALRELEALRAYGESGREELARLQAALRAAADGATGAAGEPSGDW